VCFAEGQNAVRITVQQIIADLELEVLTPPAQTDCAVTGGYASDLLSDVMAHAKPGNLCVTLQIHQNIVAVAALKELTGIIIVQGRELEKDTLDKARSEQVCLLRTARNSFDIVGRMYALGLRGHS
jgi:hypothetical protein